jgi:hypothetical protein
MKASGTAVHQRQPKRKLTTAQLNALDLLTDGKTDKETAELLKLSRACVTRWWLYDPIFRAALNSRRVEVWWAGVGRLRALVAKALDTLAEELEGGDGPSRLKAASTILRLAQLPSGGQGIGPTDAEEIVREVVSARRQHAHNPLNDLMDNGRGLPPFERHMEDTWRELEALANEPDEAGPAAADAQQKPHG